MTTPATLFAALFLALPTPYDLTRAEALIRCPAAAADGPVTPREQLAAVAVAVRLELIGPGERVGWFDHGDSPAGYAELHARLVELEWCPPLADAARLPPWRWCDLAAQWNRDLAENLRLRIPWEPDREAVLDAAAQEADWYAAFWTAAGWAQYETGSTVLNRRLCLAFLRSRVGREAWAAGDLPDAGPFHRLTPR